MVSHITQDVTLLLEDIMETDFNTVCEDESCDELGDLLCTMWRGKKLRTLSLSFNRSVYFFHSMFSLFSTFNVRRVWSKQI